MTPAVGPHNSVCPGFCLDLFKSQSSEGWDSGSQEGGTSISAIGVASSKASEKRVVDTILELNNSVYNTP